MKYAITQLYLLLILLAGICLAQTAGTISGTVTSSSGGTIAYATVNLENLTTGVKQTVMTVISGN